MIVALLLLQASMGSVSAESRSLYEPYRQCLLRQAPLLTAPQGENESGLDQARSRCLAQNLHAGSNALFAEMRTGASQSEAGDRVGALRNQVEQEVLAAVAARAPGTQADVPDVQVRDVRLATLSIPNEIAPAIRPYFDCQLASRGVRSGPPGPGQTVPPPEQLGADCSEMRIRAAQRGEAMLRDQHRGTTAARRAFVERVLADVDRFSAATAAPPPAPEGTPDAED